jgi:N-acetylmuramoyl-L-alanine amidase
MIDFVRVRLRVLVLVSGAGVGACAGGAGPEAPAPTTTTSGDTKPLPPIPAVDGAVRLDVSYPSENASIAANTNFIFGSTGTGGATLTINGAPVEVKPNGAWLAFLPVPQDGVYRLVAVKNGQTTTFERRIRAASAPTAASTRTRIVSVTPSGALAARPGENIQVGFTGTAGGNGFLVLPDGRRIPLIESRAMAAAANNAADFEAQAPAPAPSPTSTSRYSGILPAVALTSRDTSTASPVVGIIPPEFSDDSTSARVELIVGNDTVRANVNLNLAIVEMARVGVVVDRTTSQQRDWRTRGRNSTTGPFHYFWPNGTLLTITGQKGNFYRVQLAGDLNAWVPVGDINLLPEGTPPPGGEIPGARFAPAADYIDLRIATPQRLPYHVSETKSGLQIDVFGGTSQVNFFQYGKLDPLIERAVWSQPRDSVFRVDVELTRPVWGYDAFHDAAGALVLRIRRPPTIHASHPLRGLTILVDAGHGGADTATIGPTRYPEAHANLAISNALEPLLVAAGARVVMTRRTNIFLDLGARTQMAVDSGAHILVSVHNNAFPDGVNPFTNNGTSTYYYHPHSVDLAQSLQGALLAELGLRDIGYGRADLALVRPTWMPSALTETSFMMIPEQEAALKNPDWLQRVARAHVRGLEEFLRKRAAAHE